MFVAAVLLILVALVIDTARLSSANREKKNTADQAALAALRAYLDSADATHDDKYDDAVTAAEQVAGLNFLTSRWDEKHAESGEIAAGAAGTLTTGRWWFEKPSVCTFGGCPCNLPTDDSEIPGCFQSCPDTGGCPHPDGVSSTLFANAAKVSLKTKANQGVRLLFAFFTGSGTEDNIIESGIAAIKPRHTVYAVDLSRMTTYNYHLKQDATPAPSNPAEYAYRVTSTTCPGDNSNPCLASNSCTISNGTFPFDVDAQWESLTQTRSGSPPGTQHFRSDYGCFTIGSEHYLVDTYSYGYPLIWHLYLMSFALREWETYAQLHDRLGAIGYDEEVLASRTYPLMQTSAANFALLKGIASDPAIARANLFFPRDRAYSDLPEALDSARTMLQSDYLFENADNSVVLFTVGFPSCSNLETGSNTCNGTFSTHQWAFEEVLNTKVAGTDPASYAQLGIKFHAVLYGSYMGNHSILLKSIDNPNSCMSEEEMRRRNYLNFLPDTPANDALKYAAAGSGTDHPYLVPVKYLYAAARSVGGTFLGVRAPCAGSCPFTSAMNSSCASVATAPQNNPPASLPDANDTGDYAITDGSLGIQDPWSPRIYCDPNCDSQDAQVTNAFRALYKEPQLALVEDVERADVSTTTSSSTTSTSTTTTTTAATTTSTSSTTTTSTTTSTI